MADITAHSGAEAAEKLGVAVNAMFNRLAANTQSRSWRALNLLRNSALDVLGKDGHGRVYKVAHTKGTYHTASAPGEPPAPNLGNLRRSWRQSMAARRLGKKVAIELKITNQMPYAAALEEGTARMKPRPYRERIAEGARPKILNLFRNVEVN